MAYRGFYCTVLQNESDTDGIMPEEETVPDQYLLLIIAEIIVIVAIIIVVIVAVVIVAVGIIGVIAVFDLPDIRGDL